MDTARTQKTHNQPGHRDKNYYSGGNQISATSAQMFQTMAGKQKHPPASASQGRLLWCCLYWAQRSALCTHSVEDSIPRSPCPLHFCTFSRSLTAHFHCSCPGTVGFYEHILLNPPLSTPLYRATKWLLWVILLFYILPQSSVESICQRISLYV